MVEPYGAKRFTITEDNITNPVKVDASKTIAAIDEVMHRLEEAIQELKKITLGAGVIIDEDLDEEVG